MPGPGWPESRARKGLWEKLKPPFRWAGGTMGATRVGKGSGEKNPEKPRQGERNGEGNTDAKKKSREKSRERKKTKPEHRGQETDTQTEGEGESERRAAGLPPPPHLPDRVRPQLGSATACWTPGKRQGPHPSGSSQGPSRRRVWGGSQT